MRTIIPQIIFYDFECHQQNESGQYISDFVVAHSVCSECENLQLHSDSKCVNCGSRCINCIDKKLKEWERMWIFQILKLSKLQPISANG